MRRSRRQRGKSGRGPGTPSEPERIDISLSEWEAIIERSQAEPLSEPDRQKLQSVFQTLLFLTQELEKKHVSVKASQCLRI